MMYDLLFGSGNIKGGGKVKKAILQAHPALLAELDRMKARVAATEPIELLPAAVRRAVAIPRYVRVNTLKTSVDVVIQQFGEQGWIMRPSISDLRKGGKEFCRDMHLGDVLVFPVDTDLHDHPLALSGVIFLQDKASCLPAEILRPMEGSIVIDACAAPGNKTCQLSAMMRNTGRVFAFDKDAKRLSTLLTAISRAGATNVVAQCRDFLTISPSDPEFSQAESIDILVDPSCSGSGIVSRMDHLLPEATPEDTVGRLKNLSSFQTQILSHALSFPSVKRVVYSTCSVHQEENEDVVAAALKRWPEFCLVEAMPEWPHRGLDADGYTLRCHPAEDLTNGFFVACFQRREKQPLLATKRKQIDATTSPPPATDMGGAAPSAASVANAAPSESVRKKKRCKKKKKIPIPLVPSNTQVKN